MSRRNGRRHRRHEDHLNHEAWAIPYGDLVTLLLAFFVVMYAISSVNTGKYRQLSASLVQAMQGSPSGMSSDEGIGGGMGPSPGTAVIDVQGHLQESSQDRMMTSSSMMQEVSPRTRKLHEIGEKIAMAMGSLVERGLVDVNISDEWVQVDLKSDILFASGVGNVATAAEPVIGASAQVLSAFPNEVRVEGHTDDRPIRSTVFRSNWELSAARAASVVHLLTQSGVAARRLTVVAHAEQLPVRENDSDEGRSANRRVVLRVLNSDYDLPGIEAGAAESNSPGAGVP